MKLNLQFISNGASKLNMKKTVEAVLNLWEKTHVFAFFIFLFAFIALGGYFWQQNLYGSGWSNEKKQEYLNSQDRGIVFRENDFQSAIDEMQMRKEENSSEIQPLKDIFQPYKGMKIGD
jgi:hypothetical protein